MTSSYDPQKQFNAARVAIELQVKNYKDTLTSAELALGRAYATSRSNTEALAQHLHDVEVARAAYMAATQVAQTVTGYNTGMLIAPEE